MLPVKMFGCSHDNSNFLQFAAGKAHVSGQPNLLKLATRLPGVSPQPLADDHPLGSWHAHHYTIDHRNCVLFCHDTTRFTLFLAGLMKREFQDLGPWVQDVFLNTLLLQDLLRSL